MCYAPEVKSNKLLFIDIFGVCALSSLVTVTFENGCLSNGSFILQAKVWKCSTIHDYTVPQPF